MKLLVELRSCCTRREIDAKLEEGALLNNISQIYKIQGDIDTALTYLEQSLAIFREVGKRPEEGTILNDLAVTACGKNDYATALDYLEQSLKLMRELGAKREEANMRRNIGLIYIKQGELAKAEQYMQWITVAWGENGNPVGIADNPSPIQGALASLGKLMRGEEVTPQEASPSKFLINSGTEIAILDSDASSEKAPTGFIDPIGFTQFVKIKILEGPHKGKTGWIHASTIHQEQRKK